MYCTSNLTIFSGFISATYICALHSACIFCCCLGFNVPHVRRSMNFEL